MPVESTRSQNITVTWRRSPVASGCVAVVVPATGGAVNGKADEAAAAVLWRLAISRSNNADDQGQRRQVPSSLHLLAQAKWRE
jgi:hypothetical protein